MSIEAKSGKDHLKGTALKYPDDFFTLRGERVVPADSFSYYTYEALDGVKDFSTNNLSNLFLTRRAPASDFISHAALIPSKSITSVNTPLWVGKYWHASFVERRGSFGGLAEYGDLVMEQGEEGATSRFFVHFLSGSKCSISYVSRGGQYHLSRLDKAVWELYGGLWGESGKGWSTAEDFSDGALCWLRGVETQWDYSIETAEDGETANLAITRGNKVVGIANLDGVVTLALQDPKVDSGDWQKIRIKAPSTDGRILSFPMDETWVSYDNSRITGGIDDGGERSMGNIPGQLLIHHEYNTGGKANFLPLKGTLSYKGNTLRGAYTEGANDFCFRMYNSITSGFNQERGRDSILLNYTFKEQEFLVKAGEARTIDTSFMEAGVAIPLNETMFVKNGAFGSDNPETSDRIVRKTANTNGRAGGVKVPRNASYLCSWLYKAECGAIPRWMDRYYFPGALSEMDARHGKLENYIALNHAGDAETLENLQDRGYFDIESDMVVERGNIYEYRRVSPEDINAAMARMDNAIVSVAKNADGKTVNLSSDLTLNGLDYRKIELPSTGDIEAVDFNADIHIDPGKGIGIQLFGSAQNNGLVIRNRGDLAPFHYYATEDGVVLLNNRFERVHAVSLKDTYGDKVLKIFTGEPFDNVLAVSPLALYVLSYDLQLRGRISLLPGDGEGAIYGTKAGSPENIFDAIGMEQRIYPYQSSVETGVLPYPATGSLSRKSYRTDGVSLGRLRAVWKTGLYASAQEGSVSFSCTMASLFTETSGQLYHNNLYIPYGGNVVKIVFHPDSSEDAARFTESIQKSYPAMAYVMTDAKKAAYGDIFPDLAPGTMNSFRTLHITRDGTVYAYPFDELAATGDGETVFGTFKDERYFVDGGAGGRRFLFAARGVEVPSIEYASNGSFSRIHGKADGSYSFIHKTADGRTMWRVFNAAKRERFSMNVGGYRDILSLDSYSYIDAENAERTVFTLLCTLYERVYRLEWDTAAETLSRSIATGIAATPAPHFDGTNNGEALIRGASGNTIRFELYCPAFSTFTRNMLRIDWDISAISAGWYNINALADLRRAVFEVRVDDRCIGKIHYREDTGGTYRVDAAGNESYSQAYSFFTPYTHTGMDIFQHTQYLGTIGKEYGNTLNDLLKNDSLHDPYACNNCEVENAVMLLKAPSLGEYQALRLFARNINPVVLTLPCGYRNGIEEAERFITYHGGGSLSNTVEINISGHGVGDENARRELSARIVDDIAEEIDGTVEVGKVSLI